MNGSLKALFFALLISGFAQAQTKSKAVVIEGEKAFQKVYGAIKIRQKNYTTVPNYVAFRPSYGIQASDLSSWMKQFGLKPQENTFQLIGQENDEIGMSHHKYQQVYYGYPIELSAYILHQKKGHVVSLNGEVISNLPQDVQYSLSENQALESALNHIGASVYKWELTDEEKQLQDQYDDTEKTYYPKGELVWMHQDCDYNKPMRLVYKFNIYAHQPMSRRNIYIDANTGSVFYEYSLIHHADQNGTAQTAYSGTQNIVADSYSGAFRLRETGRGNGIETYNLATSTNYGSAVDFTDNDNNWNNFNPQRDEFATDAHWGSEMTYDYFFNEHSRNSIDNAGFKLVSYVHYSTNYFNAFWDGSKMTYGDGDASSNPLTSIDVAGHEIVHGLTNMTADLVYASESGALNESFSDIFGVTIDFWARPAQANWQIGEEIFVSGGNIIRDMSNPNGKNDPDCYGGTYWIPTVGCSPSSGNDQCGVHTNSGVQNFWYYLLCNGGNGTNDLGDAYVVPQIGMSSAAKIAFRNLTVYLTQNSNFEDARFYSIQSAIDIFGDCTVEVTATGSAWYAVGVGDVYSAVAYANFQGDVTQGCAAPLDVDFINLSTGANSFVWDFGDGASSTMPNPSHTYTSNGTYTVTLIADGGICGSDTAIKVDFITIDSLLPCIVVLEANDTTQTQVKCVGYLYDDGGPAGDYSPVQNSYITIDPPGATSVALDFVYFDVEAGTGSNPAQPCDYDYLEVYDGASTAGPLIGRFCNSTGNPGTLTSTGGPITLYFKTDASLEQAGFQINWTCSSNPVAPPVADFIASETNVCVGGLVQFDNISTNASSFTWSFSGGTPATSTAYNPVVVYGTPGVYPVSLTATSVMGSDTETKTGYIVVDSSFICSLVLIPGQTMATQTACDGVLYDDGGAAGNYTEFYDSYISIAPNNATYIELVFNSFGMESGSGDTTELCDYDFIEIFDGPNILSPSLGRFCGSNLPTLGSSIISSGGIVTVYFHSDDFNVDSGFGLEWHCNTGASAPPIALFQANKTLVCVGQNIQFTDQSANASAYSWTFPGGTPPSSTAQHPVVYYSSPGTYNVTLEAINASGNDILTQQLYITVNPGPIAAFSFNEIGGFNVDFQDLSNNATDVSWDFGDGTGSSQDNPIHHYSGAGVYNVCQIVANTGSGCPLNTGCQAINITGLGAPYPIAKAGQSATTVCIDNTVYFFDQSANNPTAWNWTFLGGTPASSTAQNPVVNYASNGVYEVSLVVSNANGTDTIVYDSAVVVVNANIAGFTSIQNGLTADFTNTSNGGLSWFWDFGDGNSSNIQDPSHLYAVAGNYSVCLTSINAGCENAQICTTISVAPTGPPPVAGFVLSDSIFCENQPINFVDASQNGPTSWLWEFGNATPQTSTLQNPQTTFTTPGIYSVTLTSSNANGTDTYIENNIDVQQGPDAVWSYALNGLRIYFTDLSTNSDSVLWSFGDGKFSNNAFVPHDYEQEGKYLVCLTAFNDYCPSTIFCDSVLVNKSTETGLLQLSSLELIKVYPNPTADNLHVEFLRAIETAYHLQLYNALGGLLIEKRIMAQDIVGGPTEINLSTLETGVYFLKVNEHSFRIVKQ